MIFQKYVIYYYFHFIYLKKKEFIYQNSYYKATWHLYLETKKWSIFNVWLILSQQDSNTN